MMFRPMTSGGREGVLGRAGLSIPEALGKLSIGGPLPTYVEDQQKKGHHHLK